MSNGVLIRRKHLTVQLCTNYGRRIWRPHWHHDRVTINFGRRCLHVFADGGILGWALVKIYAHKSRKHAKAMGWI